MKEVFNFGFVTHENLLTGDFRAVVPLSDYVQKIQENNKAQEFTEYLLGKFTFVSEMERGTTKEEQVKELFVKTVESFSNLPFHDCAIMMYNSHFFNHSFDHDWELTVKHEEFVSMLRYFLMVDEKYDFASFLTVFGTGVIYENYNKLSFLANCVQNKLVMKLIIENKLHYAELADLFKHSLEYKLPTISGVITRFKRLITQKKFNEASTLMINRSK
jgi:hypothetical protein